MTLRSHAQRARGCVRVRLLRDVQLVGRLAGRRTGHLRSVCFLDATLIFSAQNHTKVPSPERLMKRMVRGSAGIATLPAFTTLAPLNGREAA